LKSRPQKKRLLAFALSAAFALHGSAAHAIDLMQAYEAALKNDPTYQAAQYVNEAGQESRNLGRAALMPQISGSFSGTQNRTTVEEFGKVSAKDYLSRSAIVQVRQPLFSLEALARYKQGAAQSRYAAAVFDSQTQEVILRVSGAYLEALLKEYQLALVKVERDALLEQRNVNELLFKRGEGTRTDMLETQSRLDLAEAQLLEAQDALMTAKDTLAGIVGADVDVLSPLRGEFRVSAAGLESYQHWKELALRQNPDLRAMQQAVDVNQQEVNKQRSAHFPRLDAVGTYGKSAADSLTTINQDQKIRSIGVQLNVPIFSGGAASASTRQAVANREKAKADYEAQTDKILTELRKNHNLLVSSVARIEALEKAVASAKLLITATEQSIKGGVRINLDLLNANRQLFTAQRDLAQARFNYLLGNLRMRAGAGILSAEDVRLTAAYFE
jgi:protease secretion system outer membrane protein